MAEALGTLRAQLTGRTWQLPPWPRAVFVVMPVNFDLGYVKMRITEA